MSATTRYCAVLGHPIRHSASPAMQNAGMAALGLDWRYLAHDVVPEQLAAALAGAKAMRFIGLNLTVPHKLLALSLVDVLDESARAWGAVNTIRFEACDRDGRWRPLHAFPDSVPDSIRSHGFNTDADAILQSLREDLDFAPAGASVLLLGAGGAGRVAALKLASAGLSQLYLVNRTAEKASALAQEIRATYRGVDVQAGYPSAARAVSLVLNATSLGLRPEDALPFDGKAFSLTQARAAYDMVYRPAETPFLKAARHGGCRAANGLGMLLHQGARALELWTDQKPPIDRMREALRTNVYGHI